MMYFYHICNSGIKQLMLDDLLKPLLKNTVNIWFSIGDTCHICRVKLVKAVRGLSPCPPPGMMTYFIKTAAWKTWTILPRIFWKSRISVLADSILKSALSEFFAVIMSVSMMMMKPRVEIQVCFGQCWVNSQDLSQDTWKVQNVHFICFN